MLREALYRIYAYLYLGTLLALAAIGYAYSHVEFHIKAIKGDLKW